MRRVVGYLFVIAGLTAALGGCAGSAGPTSNGPASGNPGASGRPTTSQTLAASPADQTGIPVDVTTGNAGDATAAAGWPAGSPSDIPPFPGALQPNFWSPRQTQAGYAIRLFFSGVSQAGFAGYLAELRGADFHLQGYVLYSEGQSEQDAQARAASGDVDEVVATKDRYTLTISAPGSDGTVSFDVDGLTQAEALAMGTNTFVAPTPRQETAAPWPADWVAKLPQPDGCTVAGGAGPSSATSLFASCRYPGTDQAGQEAIAAAYKAKLLAAGFTDQSNAGGGIPAIPGSFALVKGTISVTVVTHGTPDSMIITATDRG